MKKDVLEKLDIVIFSLFNHLDFYVVLIVLD